VSGTGRRTRASVMEGAWRPHGRDYVRCVLRPTFVAAQLPGQELQPRAYIPAPVGLNYFGFSYSNNRGRLLFDASVPLEDTRAHTNVSSIGTRHPEGGGVFEMRASPQGSPAPRHHPAAHPWT
jgi:hypothetical protein